MLTIGEKEFLRLRRMLNIRNLEGFDYPKPVLASILSQKIVEKVKARHPIYVRRLKDIAEFWREKGRFPNWLNAPPMIKVRLLLKALGYTKSEIRKFVSDPNSVEDERLRSLIWKAVTTDFIYSPIAVKFQQIKGRIGEEIVRNWLERKGVDFLSEDDLRGNGGKTPDFLLEKPLNGFRWIESKAMFGDPNTHSLYWRKQFREYIETFGRGVVVYWFGHIEGLFPATTGSEMGGFPDMKVYVSDDGVDLGEPFTKDFLRNMLDLLDKFHERERIVIKPNKWAETLLSRLGFEILPMMNRRTSEG